MSGSMLSLLKSIWISWQRFSEILLRTITGVPNPKWSIILPDLYLGGQYGHEAVSVFKQWGITGIVNVRTTSFRKYSAAYFHILHIPTPDREAPTMEHIEKAISFITTEITKGGKVYIHCRQGQGRGPTVAAAYLLSTGIQLSHALELIRQVRPFVDITQVQMELLVSLEREYSTA